MFYRHDVAAQSSNTQPELSDLSSAATFTQAIAAVRPSPTSIRATERERSHDEQFIYERNIITHIHNTGDERKYGIELRSGSDI